MMTAEQAFALAVELGGSRDHDSMLIGTGHYSACVSFDELAQGEQWCARMRAAGLDPALTDLGSWVACSVSIYGEV